jgi:glycosyltransferase involved in cell wall biosynthesis
MKIAIFHLGFFYSGGGEKLIIEEIRGLRALGHEVSCYAPYVDREECFPGVPEIAEIRTFLPPPPSWLPMKDPLWVLLSCLLIPFIAGQFRSYDLFFGANQPGPWYAFILSKILRKPYVVYLAQALRLLHPREVDLENGIRIREGDHRFLMALKRMAGWIIDKADHLSVKQAQVVLTNGEHVSRWIHEVYGVHNKVCAAGCHPVQEEKLDYSNRWCGEITVNGFRVMKPYILLTNRHSPMKRFEYALWALKSIHKQVPNLSLVITGQETEYTEELRYLVDGLGLKDVVHFVGLVTETNLASLYLEAALYVYPSPEEDFGMGIVEAMAAGVPVLAWKNGGPTVTVVDGETGFLIEPYQERVFAEKMLRLATDPVLGEMMGRAGHKRAVKLFSYERHIVLLEQALLAAAGSEELESVADPPIIATNVLEVETDEIALRDK